MGQAAQISGVDYEFKLAGTTAAAFVADGLLQVRQAHGGENADNWL